ncbi:hypothetical protein AGMMS49982_12630 [Bacteroidia bacterium]|nr:hypothetical protein AGMMS49982_12630 [Bacteroidia bacterium]
MKTMAGVTYEKDTCGRVNYVRINVQNSTRDEMQALIDEIFANRNIDSQGETSHFQLIPNDETKAALEEAHTQKLKTYENVDAFLKIYTVELCTILILPDWLMVWYISGTEITFVRTGTHSDLFK